MLGVRVPFYGWVIVGIAVFASFCSGPGQSYLFSVFIDPIMADTGLSRTTVSGLYAAGTFISAAMVYVISNLADKRGARWTLALVAILFGAACFMMGLARGWLMLILAMAALRGLGQGALPINGTLMIAQWFVRRRGRAMAIAGLGGALSTAILPPVARLLIDSIGWQEAYFIFGAVIWGLLLPAAIFLARNRPEDVGLYPDGASEPPANEPQAAAVGDGPVERRNVLTTKVFWLIAIPISMPSLVDTALIFHQTSLLEARGIGAGVAAAIFIPLALSSATSNFIAGFVVDRIGPRKLFVIASAILTLPPLLLRVIDTPAMAVVYGVLIGTGSGMSMMVGRITWAHYYGRHGLGQVQGSAMMVSIFSSALGPIMLAALSDVFGGYQIPLLIMSAMMAVASLTMLLQHPERRFVRH